MFTPHQIADIKLRLSAGKPFAYFRFGGKTDFHEAGLSGFELRVGLFNEPWAEAVAYASGDKDFVVDEAPVPHTTNESEYKESVASIASELSGKRGEKTVLSRIIGGSLGIDPDRLLDVASRYFELNPDAFCLLMQDSNRRVYIMATPELLLKVDGEQFETVALAGTRPSGSDNLPWDPKNVAEQNIVEQFIAERLEKLGVTDDMTRTSATAVSNNVEHICTCFKGRLNIPPGGAPADAVIEIIDALAPTPAVCGFPREQALRHIRNHEDFNRRFYAGYVAVVHEGVPIRTFVNIRCAQIDMKTGLFAVYTGSGITEHSRPDDEWRETEMKAAPLCRLLSDN